MKPVAYCTNSSRCYPTRDEYPELFPRLLCRLQAVLAHQLQRMPLQCKYAPNALILAFRRILRHLTSKCTNQAVIITIYLSKSTLPLLFAHMTLFYTDYRLGSVAVGIYSSQYILTLSANLCSLIT